MMIKLLEKYMRETDPYEKELLENKLFKQIYYYSLRCVANTKYDKKDLYKDIAQEVCLVVYERLKNVKHITDPKHLYRFIKKTIYKTILERIKRHETYYTRKKDIIDVKKDFDYDLFFIYLNEFLEIYKDYDREVIINTILDAKPKLVPFYHRNIIKNKFKEYLMEVMS